MAAAGDGIGAGMPTEGSGTGQGGATRGSGPAAERPGISAAVLVGWLVRKKSKTNCAPRFVVPFNVIANLFYTDAEFAPMAEAVRRWW